MDRSNSGVVDTCLFNWRVPKESEKAASEMGTDGLFFVIQGSYYQILQIWKLERMRLRPWTFKHNITVAFLFSSIANLLHLGKCPKMRHANEPTVENAGSCEWRKIQRERERFPDSIVIFWHFFRIVPEGITLQCQACSVSHSTSFAAYLIQKGGVPALSSCKSVGKVWLWDWSQESDGENGDGTATLGRSPMVASLIRVYRHQCICHTQQNELVITVDRLNTLYGMNMNEHASGQLQHVDT